MARCTARYERDETDVNKTHACDLEAPHVADRPHHCPTCGSWWKALIGVVGEPTMPTERAETNG